MIGKTVLVRMVFAVVAVSNARLHIPAFVPFFWVLESRAGFLFLPDSVGIRPQHP
jgi:hypothetical protein